jgi:hypothetical protein
VSRAKPTPPNLKRGSHANPPSPPSPPLKLTYSQVTKLPPPARDPEKPARDPGNLSRVPSRDLSPSPVARDPSHDQTRSRAYTRPRDPTRFGRATKPLIGIWKTVGNVTASRDFPGDSPRDYPRDSPGDSPKIQGIFPRSTAPQCAAQIQTPTYS